MGRHKSYDRDDVLQKAMRLFWERGYHATSTRDLTEAMGINTYSLYAEFGSKEGLYEATLDRYDVLVVTGHFGRLEAPGASLDDIRSVLRFFGGAGRLPGSHLGCLLCNAAIEQAPNPTVSQAVTARYTDRLLRAFTHALDSAYATGALKSSAPVDPLARHFTTVLLGVFVLMRSRASDTLIRDAADQALARLDEYTS